MTKTAILTGITSGIGQAIKLRLEAEQWRVIGVSRHLPIDQEGYEADLSVLQSVEPLATRLADNYGKIDAFIHVAGVWHDKKQVLAGKKIHEFTAEQIISTMNVGITSAMILTAKLIPAMNDKAHMIYVSGTFQDGGANWLPYYTSKRSLEDFIVGLGSDETNVTVYGLSPSETATDSYKKFYPNEAANAQAPMSVAKICVDLISGALPASSGTIIEVRDGKPGMGYHR